MENLPEDSAIDPRALLSTYTHAPASPSDLSESPHQQLPSVHEDTPPELLSTHTHASTSPSEAPQTPHQLLSTVSSVPEYPQELLSTYTHATESPCEQAPRTPYQVMQQEQQDLHDQQHRSYNIEVAMEPCNLYSINTSDGSPRRLWLSKCSPLLTPAPSSGLLGRDNTVPGASSLFELVELQKQPRRLTLGLVVAICYFLTCGGPTGVEFVVTSAGPFLALTGLVLFPVLVSIPLGLVVSKMCIAFPDDGGFVIWVTRAFGPFWGLQEGFWFWVSAVVNNAVYPSLILKSLAHLTAGEIDSAVVEYVVKATIVVVISLPTLCGTRAVGKSSALLMLLVIVPFVVAVVWFFGQAQDYEVLAEVPDATDAVTPGDERPIQIDWKGLITALFWCYDHIPFVSLFGGQIADPVHTVPRAIFITLLLTMITYVVPLTGALVVAKVHWSNFSVDSMQLIAQSVGGSTLQTMIVVSAVCTSIGLFTTSTFAQCYLVSGMAHQKLVPKVLATRHYFFETPYLALLFNTLPVLFLLTLDLHALLDAANCLSSLSQLLLITAAIKLHLVNRDLCQVDHGGSATLVMITSMVLPVAVVGYVFVVSLAERSAGIVVVGVVYGLFKYVCSR